MSDCKYGDPGCPCQDGDTCHYEGENPMNPPYTLTRNPKSPEESDIGWNCTSADGKICVYGRTQEEAILNCGVAFGAGMLVAEKLRADTLATYLGEHAYVINCGSCIMLLERTPEDWAALALGGKEQK